MDKDIKSRKETWVELNLELNDLRSRFREQITITKEISEQLGGRWKIGDRMPQDPQPNNTAEAIRLFKEYYAHQHLIIEKMIYDEYVGVWNEAAIKSEIEKLEVFINEAKKLSYSTACQWANGRFPRVEAPTTDYYIYLLWTTDEGKFFLRYPHTEIYAQTNSHHATIYGKYYLFYNFLKSKLAVKSQSPSQIKSEFQTSLKDIWEAKDDGHYERVLKFLEVSAFIDSVDRPTWVNRQAKYKFLAGFFATCIDKKFIKGNYSAPKLREIACNTFNMVKFDDAPLKPDSLMNIPASYIEPFKKIPSPK